MKKHVQTIKNTNAASLCKKANVLLFVFLIIISGNLISQDTSYVEPTAPNGLPLYQSGKLYFQLKLNSSIVIHSRDSVSNDTANKFLPLFAKYGVTKTERPFAMLNTLALKKSYRISFNQTAKVDSFIIELSQINAVKFAERVSAVYPASISNDTIQPYHIALLNGSAASNIHISPGNAVVAIVDDAVLTTHDDLAANIYVNPNEIPNNSIDDDGNGYIDDIHGWDFADNDNVVEPPFSGANAAGNGFFTHGTMVAGVAGAVTDNTTGIASIGWNNKLMCIKIAPDAVYLIANAFDGIAYAAANGAHVINISWGGGAPTQLEYSVLVTAKDSNDVVLVAGAGNDFSSAPYYPAAYGEGLTGQPWEAIDKNLVVAVAAIDSSNNASTWGTGINQFGLPYPMASNYGTWVDIATYGINIISTAAASSGGTAINDQYMRASGTSLAAPIVSGIVGVMRSYDMSKTADDIINCLINTANPDIYGSNHPINQPGTLGSGRADAQAALQCLTSNCTNTPIAIIVPSSQSLCANTTLTLTASPSPVNMWLWNTGATTRTIAVNTPGTYSVWVSYGACTASAAITVQPPPTLTLSVSTNTGICPGTSLAVLGAAGTFTSLVWQPGGMISNSVVINPTGGVVTYSAIANALCGGTIDTISVSPLNPGPLLGSYMPYAALSNTLNGVFAVNMLSASGRYFLTADATVSGSATFNYSEILIAPNVKITVPAGSTLNLNGSYIHSCGTEMWKGIEVEDAGVLNTDRHYFYSMPWSTLIEDALTAVSSTYHATGSPASIQVKQTIFNKNYGDISLINFTNTATTYSNVLKVDNSVFTCRDFSINLSTGSNYFGPFTRFISPSDYSQLVNYGLGHLALRYASSAALNGNAAPYIDSYYTPATLKAPYINKISRNAICLGSTASPLYSANNVFTIGDTTNANNFNLFDNHNVFINAENTNVKLQNNVFQNQVYAYNDDNAVLGGIGAYWLRAAAVVMGSHDGNKKLLDMSASNTNIGNRFWDCNRAVEGLYIHEFKMNNAILRSSHTLSNPLPSQNSYAGEYGVYVCSNQLKYYIHDNEFTNIDLALRVEGELGQFISPNTYVSGKYLSALAIYNNTFTAPPSGFMSQAIFAGGIRFPTFMSSPLPELPPTLPNNFHPRGVAIVNNSISDAWNGINVEGMEETPLWIAQNTLTLTEHPAGLPQRGIELSGSKAYPPLRHHVWLNSVEGASINPNKDISLIYCSLNGGVQSPFVNCNEVKNANKGFTFAGSNIATTVTPVLGLQWLGNKMENLQNGMRLQGVNDWQGTPYMGIIGEQGKATAGMANQWNGSWSGNYGIYTSASNPTISPLYRLASGIYNPPNIGSLQFSPYGPGNGINNASGNYSCTAQTSPTSTVGNPPSSISSLQAYLLNAQFYDVLRHNDSLRESNADWAGWYQYMKYNSNLEVLESAEDELYEGNHTGARSLMVGLIAENYIEENSMAFYHLYANYFEAMFANQRYSPEDSLALINTARLCPIIYGATIYKARSLYSSIYRIAVMYDDCNEETGMDGRFASNMQNQNSVDWQIELYPNPAQNEITLKSNNENEQLHITVQDLTGRIIDKKVIQTKSFVADMELNLLNGAYLITISNNNHENITKKLLIAK